MYFRAAPTTLFGMPEPAVPGFIKRRPSDQQLTATIDLLEFANGYVLNDRVILGGVDLVAGEKRLLKFASTPYHYRLKSTQDDPFVEFLNDEYWNAGSVEMIVDVPRKDFVRQPSVHYLGGLFLDAVLPTIKCVHKVGEITAFDEPLTVDNVVEINKKLLYHPFVRDLVRAH